MSSAGAVIILDVVAHRGDDHKADEGRVMVDCGHHKPTPELVTRLLHAAIAKANEPRLIEDGGE